MARKIKLNSIKKELESAYPVVFQAIRFGIVGAVGFVVDMLIVTILFLSINLDIRLCACVGFIVAVKANYFLNRAWTFKKAKKESVMKGLVAFATVCFGGLIVRLLVMEVCLRLNMLNFENFELVINIFGIGAGAVANFIGSKLFVFRD